MGDNTAARYDLSKQNKPELEKLSVKDTAISTFQVNRKIPF